MGSHSGVDRFLGDHLDLGFSHSLLSLGTTRHKTPAGSMNPIRWSDACHVSALMPATPDRMLKPKNPRFCHPWTAQNSKGWTRTRLPECKQPTTKAGTTMLFDLEGETTTPAATLETHRPSRRNRFDLGEDQPACIPATGCGTTSGMAKQLNLRG